MKLKVQAPMRVDDGKYAGVITAVQYRTSPHEYTDLVVEFDDEKKLKYGLPTFLSPDSLLGKLMKLFGCEVTIDETYDPEEVFIGKKVSFMVMNSKSKDGKEYANIVKDSLKPLE